MLISIVNRSQQVHDAELQCVIRAINRQIREDFEPYWSFGGSLRLEGRIGRAPNKERLSEMRGDAVIYLWDTVDVAGALGYHDENSRGIPFGFVFPVLSRQLGEPWSVTLSHEALELIGDPQGNLLVQGPDPRAPHGEVFHWFEVCDAVQAQTYLLDNVAVSNFLLPLYFTPGDQRGGRNDFLGAVDRHGKPLTSFGVAEGGYIGFYDPVTRQQETYVPPADQEATARRQVKLQNGFGRAYVRMQAQGAQVAQVPQGAQVPAAAAQATVAGAHAGAAGIPDPIQHVVVLMLENRSFDQMLGGMSRIDATVEGVPRHGARPYQNDKPDGTPVVQQAGAEALSASGRDPNHELANVLAQLADDAAPMSGFVKDFMGKYADATDAEIAQVMAYFDFGDTPAGDALPVLHTLARHFTVCDHWFSSLPGPTWQNRFFVHSGTSLGHVLMPSQDAPQNMRLYYQDTLYDRLADGRVAWTIYHDDVPQSIVLTRLLPHYLLGRGYADMNTFHAQARGDPAAFPAFAFIEPRYFGAHEDDQHPPADVRRGEALIAQVYNALRANAPLWKSTLLIVTYDEHGGFFDHVPPPATVPPDDFTTEWTFDRLGVRVPTILVSPWLARGVVKTVFDHTSLLRYACDKWGLPPLGARMQPAAGTRRANTFGPELLKLKTARDDTPARIDIPAIPVTAMLAAAATGADDPPITGAREALLMYVDQLPDAAPGAQIDAQAVARADVQASTQASTQADPVAPAHTRAARGPLAAAVAPVPGKPNALRHDRALAKLARLRGR